MASSDRGMGLSGQAGSGSKHGCAVIAYNRLPGANLPLQETSETPLEPRRDFSLTAAVETI